MLMAVAVVTAVVVVMTAIVAMMMLPARRMQEELAAKAGVQAGRSAREHEGGNAVSSGALYSVPLPARVHHRIAAIAHLPIKPVTARRSHDVPARPCTVDVDPQQLLQVLTQVRCRRHPVG